MKKFIAIAIMAFSMVTAQAITVDDVFNAFPDADNVEKVNLDKEMLAMMGNNKLSGIKDISAVRVINIKEPTSEQQAIAKRFLDADIDGMESLLDVYENGENVTIYTRSKGDVVDRLLIVVASGAKEAVLVLVDGKININDINKLVKIGN
ncbi:MAG: DUF4252 domain-containing protein [Muribaculaceae bacterium]|nr:DUF4252 domain-containing protein [Muribaculaceae bacterium]MBQ2562007.1 DUF4252 domain-containing protein [Muribaculaceae bacterium]